MVHVGHLRGAADAAVAARQQGLEVVALGRGELRLTEVPEPGQWPARGERFGGGVEAGSRSGAGTSPALQNE